MKMLLRFAVLLPLSLAHRLPADTVVVFNELMYHPSANEPTMEWLELHNQMAVPVDISGWSLAGGIQFTFPSNSIVAGNGYVVVAISPSTLSALTGQTNFYGPFTGRLGNNGDHLELRNNSGRVMDQVDYGTDGDWPVAPDGSGVSLAKLDHDAASPAAENWVASEQLGGTPGADNFPSLIATPLAAPPVTLAFNEVSSSTNAPFWLELSNYGTNDVWLDGYAIYLDGAVNSQYVFPTNNLVLAPGGFLALTNTTLGFSAMSGDKLYLYSPSHARVLDSVVVKKALRGRSPDGTGRWLYPNAPTPNAPNSFAFHREIVINEIMYHHALLPSTNSAPPQESPEAWIELFNKSSSPLDLTGWEIEGGITYRFAPGKLIAPGGYLVVAGNAAYLRALYPAIDIVGDFGGRLSGKSDLIRLRDPAGNPANEVRYFYGGRWAEYANAGGSSLELRDPNADNSKAEAWAASDESHKTSWQSYSYRKVANVPANDGQPTQWNDFIFGLLAAGECLIDDLSVIESPTNNPVTLIANGDFENGLTGWRLLGDQGRSRVETDPDNPGNHVLHLIATGPQEHMHNHIETTLLNNRTVINGREYQISFRARWLAGNNLLNTRLYFNRVARTTALPMAPLNGTPGARNSRYEANLGPTFSQFQHQPVIPQPGEQVTVSILPQDPQGVSAAAVWWSANGGAWSNAPMAPQNGGGYAGTIPGYPAGTIIQFYVRAVDGLGAAATFPAAGPDSGALYAVADGQANLPLAHNVRLILTPANTALLHAFTNVMSNDNLPCTVIYDEKRAYYDMLIRLKGSERGRYSDIRVSYHLTFNPDELFRGVHPVMLIDRSGAGDSTANKQEEIVIRHILLHAGNIPGTYPDLCRVIAPMSIHTGPAIFAPRQEDEFIATAYANGSAGIEWELELVYYPTTTNPFGYKNPQPDSVIGTDITDLGNDKETYRYNFIIKNHRDTDDYSRFMTFAKTLNLNGTALDQQTRQVMDVDEWLRVWAHVSLCAVGDSYTFGNNHNLLLYLRPEDQKMLAFPVDMDFSFTRGATAALVGDQNFSKIINLTPNLRIFYAHILDIIGSTFNSSYITYWANRYDDFCPGQDFSGVPAFVQQRGDYAKSVIGFANITNSLAVNGSTNLSTGSNLLTFTGTAPVTVRRIRVNGIEYPVTWASLASWTLRVPVSEASNQLSIVGYDIYDQPITNFTRVISVSYTNPIAEPRGTIVINEIMYHPVIPEASYVELFNTSSNFTFDLSGWRLNGLAFTFPPGSFILPRQYLVLAKDTPSYLAAYGANAPAPFATYEGVLQSDGETLTLIKPGATPDLDIVIDKVRYEPGLPWATAADGTGSALQLIDPSQDHSRPLNWFSDYRAATTNYDWRFIATVGTIGTVNRLLLYLGEPGDVYIDDLSLVTGTNAAVGFNFIRNGDFEAPLIDDPPLTNSFVVATNYANSTISTDVKHSGNSSLHLVATSVVGLALNRIIYQNLSPTPANGTICTLSFWYLPTINATNLSVRIQSSDMNTNVVVRPNSVPAVLYATPGTNNLTTVSSLPPIPPLWLNEVQAENLTGLQDAAYHRGPWIELYNAGTNLESLEGLYLANNYTNLAQWAFPTGAVINPGEFKVIFADAAGSESTLAELHSDFALNAGAGSVALSRLDHGQPQVLDYVNYRAVKPDRSYGSYPDGQPFDRQEFYRVTPGAANNNTAAPLAVVVNEWMAANTRTLLNTNNNNHYDDWFELYNPGDTPADLAGYFLTDNLADKFQFSIPAGFVIPPHGYLLVWADNKPSLNDTNLPELHVNFRLDQAGEQIGISASDGLLIDAVIFEPQFTDISQGRYPDGTPSIYFLAEPTPRGPNSSWANRYPVLAPIPDTNIFLGQTLSLTAHASDPDAPPQVLAFSLDAGFPTGALIGPADGVLAWTPTPAETPSTNLITVRVTDNGTPALSAARTFKVVVTDPLRVSSITLGPGSEISITFATIVGKKYRVEFKDDLNATTWTPLGLDRIATAQTLNVTDNIAGLSQRFYRIVQLE